MRSKSNYRFSREARVVGIAIGGVAIETLKQLGGLTRVERVAYATSADVTGGTDRVVGYAGMLLG